MDLAARWGRSCRAPSACARRRRGRTLPPARAAAEQRVASRQTIGLRAGRADHRAADAALRIVQTARRWPAPIRRSCGRSCSSPSARRRQTRGLRPPRATRRAPSAVSNDAGHEALDRRCARSPPRRARRPARRAPHSADTQSADGSAWARLPPMRAAIAHGAIGDAARHRAQRATGHVGHAAVLDVGVGDAGAERCIASGVCSTRLSSAMPVMSTSRSGCTSRRLSMGPSDWPPAMNLTTRIVAPASADRRRKIGRARVFETDRLHDRAPRRAAIAVEDAARRHRRDSAISAPQRPQRVVDGVADGGRRRDRAALADALRRRIRCTATSVSM